MLNTKVVESEVRRIIRNATTLAQAKIDLENHYNPKPTYLEVREREGEEGWIVVAISLPGEEYRCVCVFQKDTSSAASA